MAVNHDVRGVVHQQTCRIGRIIIVGGGPTETCSGIIGSGGVNHLAGRNVNRKGQAAKSQKSQKYNNASRHGFCYVNKLYKDTEEESRKKESNQSQSMAGPGHYWPFIQI
jgi:hypothetical protein